VKGPNNSAQNSEGPSTTVREALLAALPGHSEQDAATIDYLLLVLAEAGYTVVTTDELTSVVSYFESYDAAADLLGREFSVLRSALSGRSS
jgi:hypothetical protein